jgi:hypothetical protein
MFIIFTEKGEIFGNQSIAINPNNVSSIKETEKYTTVYFTNGSYTKLVDKYLDVVSKLSEK